jgi:hypothetical protein
MEAAEAIIFKLCNQANRHSQKVRERKVVISNLGFGEIGRTKGTMESRRDNIEYRLYLVSMTRRASWNSSGCT